MAAIRATHQDHAPADHLLPKVARRVFRNYMVYQDGKPFLIVNAEPVHVTNLVTKFAANQPDCDWTYAPLAC